MSKEQMIRARELILQKRFDAARAILEQIDDPTARKWLAKLDEIAPVEGATSPAAGAPTSPAPVPETAAPSEPDTRSPETPSPRAQLKAARELILQKRFDAARTILEQIDDPTAQKWLAKLDQIAPADAPEEAPAAEPPTAPEASAAAPRAEQEARLIEAQRLILDSKFDAAKVMLDALTIPEAVIWRDKTQMNKFREFQSVWLDMYYYALEVDVQGAALQSWHCDVCGRDAQQARRCPQRGHSSCPVKLRERTIQDPHRLALLLGGIHMGETRNVKPLLKGLTVQQLNHWRENLEFQLAQLWEHDIRRPTLETAVILLHQLEETRKLAATGMGRTAPSEPETPVPLAEIDPSLAPASEADAAGDAAAESEPDADKDSAMRDAFKRLGKLLGGQSSQDRES